MKKGWRRGPEKKTLEMVRSRVFIENGIWMGARVLGGHKGAWRA